MIEQCFVKIRYFSYLLNVCRREGCMLPSPPPHLSYLYRATLHSQPKSYWLRPAVCHKIFYMTSMLCPSASISCGLLKIFLISFFSNPSISVLGEKRPLQLPALCNIFLTFSERTSSCILHLMYSFETLAYFFLGLLNSIIYTLVFIFCTFYCFL